MEDPNSNINSQTITYKDRFYVVMKSLRCIQFCIGPNPSMARYIYGLIYLLTSLLAWSVRDYAHPAISEMHKLKECERARLCLGAEGVLRISFGCFLFFFVMYLTTVGTKKLNEQANSWHSEWWFSKIIIWMLLIVIPFFVPTQVIHFYGAIAHFGGGIFLLIQLFSLVRFIIWLNDFYQSEKNAERYRVQVCTVTVGSYFLSTVGLIVMLILYAPKPSCKLNIIFISLTLALIQIITFISMHPKLNVGLLAPGLMGVYIVFLCWCAIRSEPQTEVCSRNTQASDQHADWLTIVSFVVAILGLALATFSTGIDSRCFQFEKGETKSEDDVPYGYGFFHFVFALGAMYFGMLFIGWDVHRTMKKWTLDVGWASTWVRAVNEWLAAIIYIWMIVAPLIWRRATAETTS